MIHFLTIHWGSKFWIQPQLRQIQTHTRNEYRIYAFFHGIDAAQYADGFFYASDLDIRDHATKLNLLADMACFATQSPDDLLVFMDSDAFPIVDWEGFVREKLQSNVLVAVRRDENLGDPQPHPCFCVTTVGFWKSIGGDWRQGYEWKNSRGQMVTDVGGNLLGMLTSANKRWHPLTRSNRINLHPLFFGIYGDLIYHHGAGSRRLSSRLDREIARSETNALMGLFLKVPKIRKLLLRGRGDKFLAVSEEIRARLKHDPLFYKRFTDPTWEAQSGDVSPATTHLA